ncbi:MAG: hypothetical protein ACREMX_15685 [Gemmatimonadales bacterium]
MISVKRVLAVTAGLVLTGVVVGAACGGIAIALVAVLSGDWRSALRPGLWTLGGVVGAVIGAVVAPVMSWLLLRHVPLGRAILQTAVGTILGGALGLRLTTNPFVAAVAGFSAAAVRLAFVTRRSRRQLESGDASGGNHTSLGSVG